jgi:hypothetical protein
VALGSGSNAIDQQGPIDTHRAYARA